MLCRSKSFTYHLHHCSKSESGGDDMAATILPLALAMMGLEVSGQIEVKVPSKGRTFGQWKAWRKVWCVVRCGKGNTIQLIIGTNHQSPTSCIDIPYNAVLCRSDSRSHPFAFGVFSWNSDSRLRHPVVFLASRSETEAQRWMLRIRNLLCPPKVPVEKGQFSVSLIDNPHSRKAGLTGLYGTLQTSVTGLTVTDPGRGQSRAHWCWDQLDSVTLDTTIGATEDKGHIIQVQTSSEFPCGEGELRLFCLEGEILEGILSRHLARPPHSLQPTIPLLAARRLSRSEGDLRCWSVDSLFHLRTQSMSRNPSHDRVASSLVSAGLGLVLTTPGCSEPDSLHDYQCLDSHWPSQDTLPDLSDARRRQYANNRRESGMSVASGIYEEIDEQQDEHRAVYQALSDPPPLPPRKIQTNGGEEEYSTADESLIYSEVVEEKEEQPLYLPMSPAGQKEDTYVVMANLVNQNNHISEPVT